MNAFIFICLISLCLAQSVSVEDTCNVRATKQDAVTEITSPVTPADVECYHKDEQLTNSQFTVEKEGDNIKISFQISSFTDIYCRFGDPVYTFYVEPVCAGITTPLYQSKSFDAKEWAEVCNDSEESTELVCVYDALLMQAKPMTHKSLCHLFTESETDNVPAGHGYVKVVYNVDFEGEDESAAYMPSWMKRIVEHDLEEVLPVPIRNCYVSKISYNDIDKKNELEVVFDTTYENTHDLEAVVSSSENSYLSDVNTLLEASIPSYWTEHSLSISYVESRKTPAVCAQIEDTEGIEYTFYTGTEKESELHKSDPYTWTETYIWNYAYNAVPENTIGEPFNTPQRVFWGAFTRYCKPKYYDALFLGVNTNSAVQTTVKGVNSLFITFTITNFDPRSANTEYRYLVARAINRYIINNDESAISTYDVNVHMIEPKTPSDEEGYYKDTMFYAQIRVLSNTKSQWTSLINSITNAQDDISTGRLKSSVENSVLEFMGHYFNEDMKLSQMECYINMYDTENWDTSNVESKTLRY